MVLQRGIFCPQIQDTPEDFWILLDMHQGEFCFIIIFQLNTPWLSSLTTLTDRLSYSPFGLYKITVSFGLKSEFVFKHFDYMSDNS